MKACIIGAGPAGLSAARMLQRHGINYDQLEKHHSIGGLWDPTNPGTPLYQSAHFISSRDTSGFHGYPMPQHFADYPTNAQVLEYTRAFAADHGLADKVECGVEVTEVRELADGTWQVNGDPTRIYDAIICANGTNWHPRQPTHPGTFNGEIRHSVTYSHYREFEGKRVLIVGLGNSGADIACDAAAAAEAAFISVRRGYHFLPKHILGKPADQFDASGPALPRWLERGLMRIIEAIVVGDTRRWGLPRPDHKLFESHPLLNTQLLHYLQHGDITATGDISHFDGDEVVFQDGRREVIDLVLYATGYRMDIPYVPREYFTWKAGRPQQYLTAFNPQHPTLFTMGFLEVNSSAYTLMDHVANLIAHYLSDRQSRPERAREFEELARTDRPNLSGGLRLINSERHVGYLDRRTFLNYLREVRERMGWADLGEPHCK